MAAPMRGLQAIPSPEAAEARTQRHFACRAAARAKDGEHGFLVSRGMAAPFAPPGEESRAQPLRVSAASGPIATQEGRVRPEARADRAPAAVNARTGSPGATAVHVLRRKLHAHTISERIGAKGQEVRVEVVRTGREDQG